MIWISRYAAGGNLFLDLEAVEALTANPVTALDELIDLLPITFRADWGIRVRRTDGGVKILHGTSAALDLVEGAAWFPLTRPATSRSPRSGAVDLHAGRRRALGDDDELVVFGRRGGPEILDSELARLGHLAALAVSIAKAG